MSPDKDYIRVKCPHCGTKSIISHHHQDFCSNCKKELNFDEIKKAERKNRALIITLFAISIVVVLVILGFLNPQILLLLFGLILTVVIGFVIILILYLHFTFGPI